MVGESSRHAAALSELDGWWRSLSAQKTHSQAVLLPVPPGWGQTDLLNRFTASVRSDDTLSIIVPIIEGASLPSGHSAQALALRDALDNAHTEHRVAKALGVDHVSGAVQLGLGVAGLFVGPLSGLIGLLLASMGVGAAQQSLVEDESAVARLARAVAGASVSVPVVVVIDSADRLDPDLAVTLIENLVARANGQVLVVAAVDPWGPLRSALTSRAAYGLTEGRVQVAAADPDMSNQARVELAADVCPGLPWAAVSRIARGTQTFTEVFAVAASERLAELDPRDDEAAVVAAVDEVINAEVLRGPPSSQAVTLSWAGGVMHADQLTAIEEHCGWEAGNASDVDRFPGLVRVSDPSTPRLVEQVRGLSSRQRNDLAQVVVSQAGRIGADPEVGLLDKVVAWQAAHRVRRDTLDRAELLRVQWQLVHGLEELGDPGAASEVAETALADCNADQSGTTQTAEYQELSAAVMRLGRYRQAAGDDSLVDDTIRAATADNAATELEARIQTAIDLLHRPDERERALALTDEIIATLNSHDNLGATADGLRLLFAPYIGQAGHPTLAQHLLAPLLHDAGNLTADEKKAREILRAINEHQADIRLQIIGLEAELETLRAGADQDRLRIHHALVGDYAQLGDYRRALAHGQQELELRESLQGPDHRDILTTRFNIATCAGACGDAREALRLLQALLPDQERLLGLLHPDTLKTRAHIAQWTGACGDAREALRLFQALLTDQDWVLGPEHHETLETRSGIARWTGECGDAAEALRLLQALLPDQEWVLVPEHPHTFTTRDWVAYYTGACGHPGEALRLFHALLPDRERVLGPDYPATMVTRYGIAFYTAECGDPGEALRLYQELLPDEERVLGPEHPDTQVTRNQIAYWSRQCGDA